jgi:hypothetical protein
MTEVIEAAFRRLGEQLPGRVSLPGDAHRAGATRAGARREPTGKRHDG